MTYGPGAALDVARPTSPEPAGRATAVFAAVLGVLVTMGWAANHFAALIPAISAGQHLSEASLDAIFGIYAVGLLPGLLLGGRASDAFGRASVALAGSATALAGTVAMLLSQQPDALLVGRLIVGAGVGLAVSSGTAWASDLKGPAGAALAGTVLIGGFAVGPFVSGVVASAGPAGVRVSFAVAAGLVAAAMVGAVVALRSTAATANPLLTTKPAAGQSTRRAVSWALPLAPWVFISATLAFVTIPPRVHTGLAAPLAVGAAALITNGTSGLVQLIARARRWGPQTGTVGALLAAVGYAVVVAVPSDMPLGLGVALVMLLGGASGLCLREGLIDLEAAAPQHVRGTLTGAFYAVSYVGFALPLLLAILGPSWQSATVIGALAALAASAAISRAIRLRRNSHRRN